MGSYRTYEEWKQIGTWEYSADISGSYRTYEEWKLRLRLYFMLSIVGSYRTYEEWKLDRLREAGASTAEFLPYL